MNFFYKKNGTFHPRERNGISCPKVVMLTPRVLLKWRCMYTHTHTHTRTHARTHAHTHTHTHTRLCMYLYRLLSLQYGLMDCDLFPQYSLAYACLKFVNYAFFFWLPLYLTSAYHWPTANADEISIWYDVGGIVGKSRARTRAWL